MTFLKPMTRHTAMAMAMHCLRKILSFVEVHDKKESKLCS
jgi:hypothetical protein